MKPEAVPAKHSPRKVPIHLKDAFHEEVYSLVDQGILEPVEHSTEWVNSFVIVEKKAEIDSSNSHSPNHTIKKKLRICLDPRDLNEALEREPYYSRSVDEIIGKFHDAVVFTVVDMKKGYWMVVLHPDSRALTCMALDIGRFQWTRLPMGTVVASDIFQRKLDEVYANLPGVTGIADDMIVYGNSIEDHDRNFLRFLEVTRQNNLRLNKEKLQFRKTTVNFFGHQWNAQGLSPDPKKVQALTSMEFPRDKETMQSFLGLVNFLNRYSANLVELSQPLRDLCKMHADYKPSEKHFQAFKGIKGIFHNKIQLPYFNSNEHTTLQTDSSKRGLGAVLLQGNSPIYFASRSLSKCEQNYQNLERETLATIWGMERFHYFLYGKPFTLETDQKPLASIYNKHLINISPRIQRLIIRSLPYNFQCVWKEGRKIPAADALSRVSPENCLDGDNKTISLPIITVNMLTEAVEPNVLIRIRQSTTNDPYLARIISYIKDGFPEDINQFPQELKGFWNIKDELSVEDGIILKGHKIFIPTELKSDILEQIHEGHLGMEKCINRARNHVYWIGISNDIRQMVEKCSICQRTSTSQKKPAPQFTEIPPFPWHTLGTDLFYWKQQDWLVLADYFSKYLIVRKLPSSTTQAVSKEISMIFTEFGRPFVLRSDNGPCYASKDFKQLMEQFQVEHITSSPHYPQSNGFAESQVKIAKKLMERSTMDNKPWNFALWEYRTTPISNTLPSPLEILMQRVPRTSLPSLPGSSTASSPKILQYREELRKRYGNSTTESISDRLEPGQPVWVQDPLTLQWKPGTVKEHSNEPSSYWITSPDGATFRRTRKHLKPRLNPTATEMDEHLEKFRKFPTNAPEPPTTVETNTGTTPLQLPANPTSVSANCKGPAQPTQQPISSLRRSHRINIGVPPKRYAPS